MSTCPVVLLWLAVIGTGFVAALASLWYAVGDSRSLRLYIRLREEDPARRDLRPRLVARMRRIAFHAVFEEVVRVAFQALFLWSGVLALVAPTHALGCAPPTTAAWLFIGGGFGVALNSLHALWTRRGGPVFEGDRDPEVG